MKTQLYYDLHSPTLHFVPKPFVDAFNQQYPDAVNVHPDNIDSIQNGYVTFKSRSGLDCLNSYVTTYHP